MVCIYNNYVCAYFSLQNAIVSWNSDVDFISSSTHVYVFVVVIVLRKTGFADV